MVSAPDSSVVRVEATCAVLVAFDVGLSVDLAALDRDGQGTRRGLRQRRRAVEYFEYRPAPLRVTVEASGKVPTALAGDRWRPAPWADMTVYDFGAVSVTYTIPYGGTLAGLIALSAELADAAAFHEPARALVEEQVSRWGRAVVQPQIAQTVETYLLFHLERLDPPMTPAVLCATCATDLARLLRSEVGPLAEQEVAEATVARVSYGPDDLALVDWNAAVVYGPEVEDIRTVVDFANVQLLEMRHLDHELDLALDRSYGLVSRRLRGLAALRGQQRGAHRVAQMQVDAAVLFERVSSVLKIFGEQYLARAYRHLADRFRLRDWDASIQRKLQTLDTIYTKLSDEAGARRLELLEWIIVLLIAFEVVMPFLS